MMTYVAGYFAALFVFVVLDMAWLAAMASRLYRPTLGNILIADVNLPPAIMFYLFYPVGLVVFALISRLEKRIDHDGGGLWCTFRLPRLCHLRSNELFNTAELDDAAHNHRPFVGNHAFGHRGSSELFGSKKACWRRLKNWVNIAVTKECSFAR